jgi:hypothetical protein
MRPNPRSGWLALALAALTLWSAVLGYAQDVPDPMAPGQVIDVLPVYIPLLGRDYPDLFPPPVQARRKGWLGKWSESQPPNTCLAASGTPYYLERERGEAGWVAAVAETEYVSDLELEVHLGEQVVISGTAEFFSPDCDFPRLNAHSLEVVDPGPDLSTRD